jgi:ribose 5-phosphate isomerase B
MKIIVASDHAGFKYKEEIIRYLVEKSFQVIDGGTFNEGSCHYPEYAISASEKVVQKEADMGVLICGSGMGISIASNKVKGARCAVGYHDEATIRSRIDNDANLIAFGSRFMNMKDILRRIDLFLTTPFEGGRHQTRIDLIQDYEDKHYK